MADTFLTGAEGLEEILRFQATWPGCTLFIYSGSLGVPARVECFDRLDQDVGSKSECVVKWTPSVGQESG